MAHIYGSNGTTKGEKAIYLALSKLGDDWTVYSQPEFQHDEGEFFPDFVLLHKQLGLIIIEVKDWLQIEDIKPGQAYVYIMETKEKKWLTSPVSQARTYSNKLKEILTRNPKLRDELDRLKFPLRYAGFLPNFSNINAKPLKSVWGENQIFVGTETYENRIELTLRSIPAPFNSTITDSDLDLIRGLIDPDLKCKNGGVLDQTQEEIAKLPLTSFHAENLTTTRIQLSLHTEIRISTLEESLPEEITSMSSSQSVRLIRGSAGTGKTDVVILRSSYLKKLYPEAKILVTTFNIPLAERRIKPAIEILAPVVELKRFGQICHEILKKKLPEISEPQKTEGVVNAILSRESKYHTLAQKLGSDFLVEEIQWMKELDLTSEEIYVDTIRQGRGGAKGMTLTKAQKAEVFDFFATYQAYLKELPANDWNDWYNRALGYVRSGEVEFQRYDEIIVDEAQHFAPKWIQLLKLLVKENGSLYLCEDPGQSVYRAYSWKQKGVDVLGRTRWLRVPYRNTRQILEAAYNLQNCNRMVFQLLSNDDSFELPDLSLPNIRNGDRPEVHQFNNLADEREFVRCKILHLVQEGILPQEIAILHNKTYVLSDYKDLESDGVFIDEVRRETGMEYKMVFIPKIADFFNNRNNEPLEEENNLASLYTALTRAKDMIYLLYEGKKPKELDPLMGFVNWIDHRF